MNNLFLPNVLTLETLETQEHKKFSDVLKRSKMRTLARNGLNHKAETLY